MRITGVHYITAWGWGPNNPHSANRKQASRIINNSDSDFTEPSLHNELMSNIMPSQTLTTKPCDLWIYEDKRILLHEAVAENIK